MRRSVTQPLASLTALLIVPLAMLRAAESESMPEVAISLSLQARSEDGTPKLVRESWRAQQTAIIVCDMWDLHHCHNAVRREAEMAPRMNEVIEKARAQGMFIIHAPSSCMKAYEGHPGRQRAQTSPRAASLPDKIGQWCKQIPAEEKAVYPIDQSDGGEDDDPDDHAAWAKQLGAKGLNPRAPWTRQTDALRIADDKDAISDSGVEIWNLLEARGIRNVILMGVHVNMCVAGRPFGLRQMATNGKHVVLMRDMTDSMYNPARWPHVDHVRGTALFIEHVEKYICPTITSDQLIGGKPFAFSVALRAETGPVIVSVTRDTWVSAVGKEREGNNGASPRLKFKGIQEFSLVDGDFATLKGRRIARAALRLHMASKERLRRVTVSTVSAPWEEGTGQDYAKVPGAACFQLPGAKPDITAVILGNGRSIWKFAEASEPDRDGWQSIPVAPAIIQARIDGRSHGFAVIDDVGNEWTRQGDDFRWQPFPNRFFHSRHQNASVAPRFEVWLADGEPVAVPTSPAPASLAEPKSIDLPPIGSPEAEQAAQQPIAVGDLFGRPVVVLRAARGETVWMDLRAEARTKLDFRVPHGFSGSLFSVEAHGDALVPCDSSGTPLAPERTDPSRQAGHWLAEVFVPKSATAGRHTVRVTAGYEVPLDVWDFALPDRLSFVPQMNAYSLPDAQETAYYRLAHGHRTCLNCLRYSWQGRVADGCAPKTAADGSWDWAAWDRRFGPLLDGSAFADLKRARTPVDNFYLPLNENWPLDHERAYRGGYWVENAYPDTYWAEFRAAAGRLARHVADKGWTRTTFEFYLNNKVYFKAQRGSWSKCSAPWIFDEPVNTQDFWALRRFGREFLAATGGAANLVFRCDISRPQWQRDLLDGVCGEEVVSGSLRTYRDRILARQARYGQTVLLYGSPNKIGTPNVHGAAWCLDAWCLGADGVVPWNTIGKARSWLEPDQTCLFYPTADGPLPSLRLKAFCHGQQLVEYAIIFTRLSGHDRRSVAEALRREIGLDGHLTKVSEEDAGTTSYDNISPESLERVRVRLGAWIAAQKPADRDCWKEPRSFGPLDGRPDGSFFVTTSGSLAVKSPR